MNAEGRIERLQGLMEKLEATRTRLEEADDPELAVEILSELSEVAKEIQAEIEAARREGPDPGP